MWSYLQIWPQILMTILLMMVKIHKFTNLHEDSFRGMKDMFSQKEEKQRVEFRFHNLHVFKYTICFIIKLHLTLKNTWKGQPYTTT